MKKLNIPLLLFICWAGVNLGYFYFYIKIESAELLYTWPIFLQVASFFITSFVLGYLTHREQKIK